jgi:hypothetical protein
MSSKQYETTHKSEEQRGALYWNGQQRKYYWGVLTDWCPKQNKQGKAAFNERNPNTTQHQEPVARSPGGPQTKNRTRHKAGVQRS